MASRKLCYTKTGLKKSPLKSGRCPQGSNRSRRNKDAATGRKRGYAAKRGKRGGCSSPYTVKISGYTVKGKKIKVKSKRTGKLLKTPKSITYTVKPYCRGKAKKRAAANRGRRAGSGFVCVSKKTGRWTDKLKSGGCRKGSKRSRRF